MATPYAIEIYVPSGEPEGFRIVSLKNLTGIGLVFPTQFWAEKQTRTKIRQTGVYILSGLGDRDTDMAIFYIGQTVEFANAQINTPPKKSGAVTTCKVQSTRSGITDYFQD